MKVAFLLSRQERGLTPHTWWLQAAHAAARWAADRGWTLVSGSGLLPINFVRWSYRYHGGAVQNVGTSPTFTKAQKKQDAFIQRDRAVVGSAESVVAIAVRKGGIMLAEGLKALDAGKTVYVVKPPIRTAAFEGNFQLLHLGAKELEAPGLYEHVGRDRKPQRGNASVLASTAPFSRHEYYLWHFTRRCNGPWPGQTEDDYFLSLIENRPGAAHTGLNTLIRILTEQKIRASSKIIRGRYGVVSLSAEIPNRLLITRRFRASLARWDFEPYAVGIKRELAGKLGMKPVSYLPSKEYQSLSVSERPFFQRGDKDSMDWRHEKEWRYPGDLNLEPVSPPELCVVIPNSEVPDAMERLSQIPKFSAIKFSQESKPSK